jgi:hypothetical protein
MDTKTPDAARDPRKRQLLQLLGLSAAAAYSAPVMTNLAPASAQTRMTGATRTTRPTRMTRPSR